MDHEALMYPVEGVTKVIHKEVCWIIDAVLKIAGVPREFVTHWEVVPLEGGGDSTPWQADSPSLGRMVGRFIIVDDSIISLYGTEDGRFRGTEYFRMIDEDLYWNRGALLQGEVKVSSWAVELRRL